MTQGSSRGRGRGRTAVRTPTRLGESVKPVRRVAVIAAVLCGVSACASDVAGRAVPVAADVSAPSTSSPTPTPPSSVPATPRAPLPTTRPVDAALQAWTQKYCGLVHELDTVRNYRVAAPPSAPAAQLQPGLVEFYTLGKNTFRTVADRAPAVGDPPVEGGTGYIAGAAKAFGDASDVFSGAVAGAKAVDPADPAAGTTLVEQRRALGSAVLGKMEGVRTSAPRPLARMITADPNCGSIG